MSQGGPPGSTANIGLACSERSDRDVNVWVNDREYALDDGGTILDLLAKLQVTVRHVAVEVNGVLVPRERHAEHALGAGDRIEVVTLVGGG